MHLPPMHRPARGMGSAVPTPRRHAGRITWRPFLETRALLFRYFESRIHPYPPAEPELPPKGFLAFVWAGTRGVRGFIALLAGLSAGIAAYEAFLFAVLGHVVDWLVASPKDELWVRHGGMLWLMGGVLVASTVLVALQTIVKHQAMAINFPLRLRWNFHRLMLGQSMAFYADEFAGRITTKVMQTALGVRDMIFTSTDVLVGIGAVAAVTAMALRISGMSHWIMWEMTSLFENVGTVQDGINTLTRPRAVVDAADAQPLVVPRGEVRFDDVSFRYGTGTNVIDRLSLTVKPGERIGLIGRSGAGKSTLVNLLLRFHDVSGGQVRIDGQDIAHVTQDSLRAHIGMVTQDTSLLHRSMRDNILYGRPDAGEEAMVVAARRAEAHDFIQHLSDLQGRTAYDAHVGERGVKLSGGQRQRVAIARVMLKDAPILLLDEATSALDSEVEAAIQASLDTLMEGKTVIAIAHRLSTIAAMDRLIVLDGGRIVEEGDHRSLLAQGGIYARLWAHQSGGFLGEAQEEDTATT